MITAATTTCVCWVEKSISHKKNIPRAVIVSILLVAALYLLMNLSIIGSLNWRIAQHSQAIAADFMQAIYGRWAGLLVSVLVLVVSFRRSLREHARILRIPYAAAADGHFFSPFAQLAQDWQVSNDVALCSWAFSQRVACLFSLVRADQGFDCRASNFSVCRAVHRSWVDAPSPPGRTDSYRMPLYPLPAVIALLGWIYIAASSGLHYLAIGMGMVAAGLESTFSRRSTNGSGPSRLYEEIRHCGCRRNLC